MTESALMVLLRTITGGDASAAERLLAESPHLASGRVAAASSHDLNFYLHEIEHYVYGGDTALHVAAAAYRVGIVELLIGAAADVRAKNRRGAEPLHYAADGIPGSVNWDPDAQATTVVSLIRAGADPNAIDNSGVTPLLRAVRTRCAGAVGALLDHGADPQQANRRGHWPMMLATRASGRGGSGSSESKVQQALIVRLLQDHGGTP